MVTSHPVTGSIPVSDVWDYGVVATCLVWDHETRIRFPVVPLRLHDVVVAYRTLNPVAGVRSSVEACPYGVMATYPFCNRMIQVQFLVAPLFISLKRTVANKGSS